MNYTESSKSGLAITLTVLTLVCGLGGGAACVLKWEWRKEDKLAALRKSEEEEMARLGLASCQAPFDHAGPSGLHVQGETERAELHGDIELSELQGEGIDRGRYHEMA